MRNSPSGTNKSLDKLEDDNDIWRNHIHLNKTSVTYLTQKHKFRHMIKLETVLLMHIYPMIRSQIETSAKSELDNINLKVAK